MAEHNDDDEVDIAMVVCAADGTVVEMNDVARSLIGADGMGKLGWDALCAVPGNKDLPCARGCVCRVVAAGTDKLHAQLVELRGHTYQMCCLPVHGYSVTSITAAPQPAAAVDRINLTAREIDVLEQLAAGLTTPEIAVLVGISESTVRTHVEHMRHKFGVATRAALVAQGFLMGYLSAHTVSSRAKA